MRIRKGHRGLLPVASEDRLSARRGLLSHAAEVNHEHQVAVEACISGDDDGPLLALATPRHRLDRDLGERANGTWDAGTDQRTDVDHPELRLSAGDAISIRRPQISEGVGLSITSIIQAGKGSPRSGSASTPASAESVVTSDASDMAKGARGCSPSAAMEAPATEAGLDQPALLLQSLKRVCTTAGNAGLTPKEAVAKILEKGLPGLHEGGERLIVQVAKSFRASSSAFHEERGRYFIQKSPSVDQSAGAISPDSGNSSSRRVIKAVIPRRELSSEIETAIEAARQLQNLQRVEPELESDSILGFRSRDLGKASPSERRVVPSRSKTSSARGSSTKPSSSSRDQAARPRCNRDDGKGWRCFRPAESGFSLCKYHRDQIRRAEMRRRRSKSVKSKEQSIPAEVANSNPPPTKSVPTPQPDIPTDNSRVDDAPESAELDDGLPDRKRRRSVKAKSLKSIR